MLKHLRPALVSLALFTALTGLVYPLVVTGIAQVLFPRQANGSLIMKDGKAVGSELIGQPFDDPKSFWGRPSATSPFADNAGAKDAQLYHRDGDDYRFCKLFVQLTDVDEDGGPHTFVEGSHDWNTVRALREKWSGGPVEFNEWYFGTLRKADDKVERVFGRKGVKLTGPAGTRFLVDTSGIHKGTPPVKADRLMAQVLYGVTPHAQAPLLAGRFPIPAGSLKGARVPKRVADPPFDYVTWLFLT